MMNCCEEKDIIQEEFSFTSSLDGVGPLRSLAVYSRNARKLPLMILQCGYCGGRDSLLYSAKRMAARGYFCVGNGRRGMVEQPGHHDDGGIEIMDIYDSRQAAVAKYGEKIDGSGTSIIGYSNGGGNVFSALVRFPYLFRAGMALFGISDYGKWASSAFSGNFAKAVIQAVGGTPEEVPDKYLVRNAVMAAGNLRGVRFHIACDEQETTCPISMDEAFVEAAKKTGYENIFVHASKASDQHRWLHGYNDEKNILSPIEDIFMDDIEKNPLLPPQMGTTGSFTVPGFLVTPSFTCVVGCGDDAVATINYQCTDKFAKFTFTPISSDKNARARITLPENMPHKETDVIINGKSVGIIKGDLPLKAETTIDGTLEFRMGNR